MVGSRDSEFGFRILSGFGYIPPFCNGPSFMSEPPLPAFLAVHPDGVTLAVKVQPARC